MPTLSFGAALRTIAASTPHAPAITDDTLSLTWMEADRLCDVGAAAMAAAGVREGDVVALSGANSAYLLVATFAVWRVGGVPLHLHARKNAAELDALLELGQPRIAIGFDAVPSGIASAALHDLFTGNSGNAAPVPDKVPKWLRIGPSGGSTGRSKLIVVETPALIDPQRPWFAAMRSAGTQVLPLDLMDGAGFVMATIGLATGSHIILMEHFDPETTLRLIERHRADWLALTPPLMLRIWKLPPEVRTRFDLSSLRAMVQFSGGAAPWLKQAWIDWLGPERIYETYGGTDARGSLAIDGIEWLAHPGSVGTPDSSCQIIILDDAKQPVPQGVVGDIYMRDLSGGRRFHYLGAQMETLEGGWETVGDMGHVDESGYLYIADRRKDVIHTRQGAVYPLEIEGAIERHPAILSCVVIGLPDDSVTERIHALIEVEGAMLDVDELRRFLAGTIDDHKLPNTIEESEAPLRDTAGKARRADLRAARGMAILADRIDRVRARP